MSIEVFNKAKEMSRKIFELHQYMIVCDITKDFNKFGICAVSNNVLYIKRNYDVQENHITVLTRDHIPSISNPKFNIDNSYIVLTDRDYFILNGKKKRLISTVEFDEAWDFQCQSLFDDTELFQYYLFCSMKSLQLTGVVIRRIDDEMIDILSSALKAEYDEAHGTNEKL